MSSAKYVIDNVFKTLASAEMDDDVKVALSGDILNPDRNQQKIPDPRGKEYGYFVVHNVAGGKKVQWYAGVEFVGENKDPILGYTCYVSDDDWDIFQSEHSLY